MNLKNSQIMLSNAAGKKTSIIINAKEKKSVAFEEEHLDSFMTNAGVSVRHMRKVASFIRSRSGRKSVPTNYASHVTEKLNTLQNVYISDTVKFDIESSK